ncbi:hypothetical protein [Silvanigrella sp.]|jgi:hypothetical protein|uniref:hypothetical protein n=1 Tax=Silvanigrella sp. TaxID=2024976 RepID=UPI0037C805E3
MKFKFSILIIAVISLFSSCTRMKTMFSSERYCTEERKIYINKKTNKRNCNPIGYEEEADTGTLSLPSA